MNTTKRSLKHLLSLGFCKMSIKSVLMVSSIVLVVGCSGKPTIVNYEATESKGADWYPIPADAPSEVVVEAPTLPRIAPEIEEATEVQEGTLAIESVRDSIGNISLLVNRSSSATWELVDQAFTAQQVDVSDKDRSEYRFFIGQSSESGSWLSRLFSPAAEPLSVVLIPQGGSTLVVVEAADNKIPEESEVLSLLNSIQEYYQAQS